MMLAIEWAQKDENPIYGHKVMAKKWEQVGKFKIIEFFGHNFMANNRIGVFFSFNDSFWCGNRMIYGLTGFD